MIFNIIYKVAAVVMTVCAFVVTSCVEKEDLSSMFEMSVDDAVVGYEAGSTWVNVRCDSEWTLSIEYTDGDSNPVTDAQPWASLSSDSGITEMPVSLSYKRNNMEAARYLNLVLTRNSDSKKITHSVTQLAYGEKLEDLIPVKPDVDVTKVDWLELPKMSEDSGLEYYAHKFEMNSKTYRNYSIGWSQKDYVSVWVAYPLCSFYTNKTVQRTNAWSYDPYLGSGKSSAPFGGYGGYEYDRGHQLPSADRLCCTEANKQTFYGTNIAPQGGAHNTGIWSTLEMKVRDWANTSDTTYVVTGCVVKGSTEKTYDSDKNQMTVPVAFYKALLRYHKNSTIAKWACAGFYTEHRGYESKDLKAVSMSIDELEELTGLDFFPNLASKVGETEAAKLEAQDPTTSNVWWK